MLAPDSYGGAGVGIAVIREIDVEVGVVDENANEEDPSVRSSEIIFRNLPESVTVLLIGTNVPSARVAGLDGYYLGSVVQRTLDIEVLPVVDVLKRPTVAGVLNPPLCAERLGSAPRMRRGKNEPSGCHSPS